MFVYDSLDDAGGSSHAIRLLTILRSHDEEAPVECKLTAHEIFQRKEIDHGWCMPCNTPTDCVHERPGQAGLLRNKGEYVWEGMEYFPSYTKEKWDCILCARPRHAKHDIPTYEALSYVWGGTLDQTQITINGKAFSITKRLESALKDLRQPESDRVIWVDAICIDQKNTAEKTKQVLLMALIYQSAVGVVAWLDPGCEIGHLAIETIEELGGSQHDLVEDPRYKLQTFQITAPRMVPKVMPNAPGLKELAAEDDQKWKSLQWFLTQRWWKRIWILQEAHHAKELSFQVGRRACLLDSLENIIYSDSVQEGDYLTLQQYELFKHLTKLLQQRAVMNTPFRDFGVHQAAPLATLLSEYDYCESTDPRDMIYALLNLADIDKLGITPEYGKTVCNVYHDATKAIIETDDSLEILHSVQRSMKPSALRTSRSSMIEGDRRRTLPLASWAPDFAQKKELKSVMSTPGQRTAFRAAGDSKPVCRFGQDYGLDMIYSVPEYVMIVMGRSFDVLDWTPACIPQSAFEDETWERSVRAWIRPQHRGPQATSSGEPVQPECIGNLLPQRLDFSGYETPASHNDARKRNYPGGGTYEDAIFSALMSRPEDDTATAESRSKYDLMMANFCEWMEGACAFQSGPRPGDMGENFATTSTSNAIPQAPADLAKGTSHNDSSPDETTTGHRHAWKQKRADYKAESKMYLEQESKMRGGRVLSFQFLAFLWFFLPGRKLAYTKSGRVALVPFDAREGDILAVLKGFDVPVVLRNYTNPFGGPMGGERKKKMFVGTAYVHGVMQGDKLILALLESSAEWFTLV